MQLKTRKEGRHTYWNFIHLIPTLFWAFSFFSFFSICLLLAPPPIPYSLLFFFFIRLVFLPILGSKLPVWYFLILLPLRTSILHFSVAMYGMTTHTTTSLLRNPFCVNTFSQNGHYQFMTV